MATMEERHKHDEHIRELLPSDPKEFKKIFQIEDSMVEYYKDGVRVLLYMVYPDITWDKDTGDVILEKIGTVKGLKILDLFSQFMYDENWVMYTMSELFDGKDLVCEIKSRYNLDGKRTPEEEENSSSRKLIKWKSL